jgi:hypothetical protein
LIKSGESDKRQMELESGWRWKADGGWKAGGRWKMEVGRLKMEGQSIF